LFVSVDIASSRSGTRADESAGEGGVRAPKSHGRAVSQSAQSKLPAAGETGRGNVRKSTGERENISDQNARQGMPVTAYGWR